MKAPGLILALAVGAGMVLWSPAWSDEKKGGEIAAMAKDAQVTISQAIQTASQKIPGTVVEAELEKKQAKTTWKVKVLGADGKLTKVYVDAATGTVIDTEAAGKKNDKKEFYRRGAEDCVRVDLGC